MNFPRTTRARFDYNKSYVRSSGKFHKSGATAVSGYVAFKQAANGHNYYGWLKVKVTENGNKQPTEIQLVANSNGNYGAYDLVGNTTSDGFTVGDDVVPVPEPIHPALVGLGLLAVGAAGVRELRRRRNIAGTKS